MNKLTNETRLIRIDSVLHKAIKKQAAEEVISIKNLVERKIKEYLTTVIKKRKEESN